LLVYVLFTIFGYSFRYSVIMQATTGIFYQKAPAKRTKKNLIPVKLRVQRKKEKKYYSLKEKITNKEWLFIAENDIKKITTKNPRGYYKDIAIEYRRIVKLAEDIIKGIPVFSFGLFEERFFNRTGSWDNIFSAMIEYIRELKLEGRFGYATSFESTLRAVKEFHEGKKLNFNSRNKVESRYQEYESGRTLTFQDITVDWLKRFGAYLKDQGKSKSTIGIYTRNIRRLFNLAIKEHGSRAEYPFHKYRPNQAGDRKIALTLHQVSLIANYQTEDPQELFYRDCFTFSFLGNGMNPADLIRLRYSNIINNEIVFQREKTKNSEKPQYIRITLTKRMQSIINQHGNRAIGHDAFIFNVLKSGMSERKQFDVTKEFVNKLNTYLKRIALAVGIKERISSYVSRHSFATISKNSGASVEYLKEALGHSNVAVTEAYLKSFESDTRRKHAERLEEQIFKTDAV